MNKLRSASFLVLLFALCFPSCVHPQSPASDFSSDSTDAPASYNPPVSADAYHGRYRELTIYSGQSFGYPQIMSGLDGQRVFLVGARLTSRLHSGTHFDISYNADLKPLVLHSEDSLSGREYTYGGGGAIGLQFLPHTNWRWQPFFDVDGGVVAFTKNTPIPEARRVNINLEFGPGFYLPLDDTRSLRTGVWFFHFSNAETAPRNPAFDGFVAYMAFTVRHVHPPRLPKRSS